MIDLEKMMIVFLRDDGVSLQMGSDSASYSHSGKIQLYAGSGGKTFPSHVIIKDKRTKTDYPEIKK